MAKRPSTPDLTTPPRPPMRPTRGGLRPGNKLVSELKVPPRRVRRTEDEQQTTISASEAPGRLERAAATLEAAAALEALSRAKLLQEVGAQEVHPDEVRAVAASRGIEEHGIVAERPGSSRPSDTRLATLLRELLTTDRLTSKERFVLEQRLLLGRTAYEVARELGVTPERVRGLVTRALRKLRMEAKVREEGSSPTD